MKKLKSKKMRNVNYNDPPMKFNIALNKFEPNFQPPSSRTQIQNNLGNRLLLIILIGVIIILLFPLFLIVLLIPSLKKLLINKLKYL